MLWSLACCSEPARERKPHREKEHRPSLQLIVDTAEMLGVPLFTAEALLRFCEWSKEALRIEWSREPLQTCLRAGLTPPSSLLGRAQQQQQQPQYGQLRTAAGRQGWALLCSACVRPRTSFVFVVELLE